MEDQWIRNIIYGDANAAAKSVIRNRLSFAKYTDFQTALKIISSRTIWMRNALLMNDFSEIEHGKKCIEFALSSDAGKNLRETLDKISFGMLDRSIDRYKKIIGLLDKRTYISSFSLHAVEKEGEMGRLSMWRGYGGNNGIAFIFKLQNMLPKMEDSNHSVYMSPVFYYHPDKYREKIQGISHKIRKNYKFYKNYFPSDIETLFVQKFLFESVTLKHPGFEEEDEWRTSYWEDFPGSYPPERVSIDLGGRKEIVCKIKMDDFHELERIIIGPSSNPFEIRKTIISSLQDAGFSNAQDIVYISQIPFRFIRH